MPARDVAARELASLIGVFGHHHRIRIVEELRTGEHDVAFLAHALDIPHARVSQHLATLRAHRLVHMRREGRHVYYRLVDEKLARWLVDGFEFVEDEARQAEEIREAVAEVRELWTAPE
jgi:DNA-binding transcriptional ArsR family regulator